MATTLKRPRVAYVPPRGVLTATATFATGPSTGDGGAHNAATLAALATAEDGNTVLFQTSPLSFLQVRQLGFSEQAGLYTVTATVRMRTVPTGGKPNTPSQFYVYPLGFAEDFVQATTVNPEWGTYSFTLTDVDASVLNDPANGPLFYSQSVFDPDVEVDYVRVTAQRTTPDWVNTDRAINSDLTPAVHSVGQPGAWLYLTFTDGAQIPDGDVVVGLKLGLMARAPSAGTTAPPAVPVPGAGAAGNAGKQVAEVALTLNGAVVGDVWRVYLGNAYALLEVGGTTALFGRTWTPRELNSQGFGVAVRRSAEGDTGDLHVDATSATVYHNPPGGSLTAMAIRETSNEKVLIAPETTPGAGGSSFRRLRELNFHMRPNFDMKIHTPQGEKLVAVAASNREWSTGSIDGLLGYNEFPYLLEGNWEKGVHTGGTPGALNTHTYTLETRKQSDVRTWELQRGDNVVQGQKAVYTVFNGFEVGISTSDCTVSGGFFAYPFTQMTTLATGQSEVQTVTLVGTPTGGTFRLSYKGAETGDLAYNIAASALQTALQALTTVGAGNATVTGTGPWVVTFASQLAGQDVKLLRLSRNNLTGGTTPTVAITQTTQGGWPEVTPVPVLWKHWNIYMADTYAGLDAGKITKAVAAGFGSGNRFSDFWTLDRDVSSFTGFTEDAPEFTASLIMHADSNGMALLANARAGTPKALRLEAQGGFIGNTSDRYKIILESFFYVSSPNDLGDEANLVTMPYDLVMCEGPNGEVPTFIIQNGITTY